MGPGWRMPGTPDYRELMDNCDFSNETIGGLVCIVATSRINGAKLLLPAGGYIVENQIGYLGSYAAFWTVRYVSETAAYWFRASVDGDQNYTGQQRRDGVPIRAVRDP